MRVTTAAIPETELFKLFMNSWNLVSSIHVGSECDVVPATVRFKTRAYRKSRLFLPPAKVQSKMTVKVARRESKLPVKVGMELAGSQAASGLSADVAVAVAVAVAASRAAWLILKRS